MELSTGPQKPSGSARVARDLFGLVGTTVAEKYAIDGVIGEGGYGVVYAARHLLVGRPIALKCMKPLGTSAEDTAHATGLFLREAQVLFGMSHPGIVRLYDVGTLTTGYSEVPYAVLELVDGRSLEQDIEARAAESRPFSRGELEQLFVGVLEALAFTHDAGVAHRDLKPSNIMLVGAPEGGFRTKVLDFGVARFVARDTKHSTGLTGFTPAYAAPEQWSDGLGDSGPATDVFSVALTLAEACTLRTVMHARTPAQIFGAVMAPGRKAIISTRSDLPAALQLVMDRALQVQPSARYPNARAMLDDVRSAFATGTVAPATMPVEAGVTLPHPPSFQSMPATPPGPDPNGVTRGPAPPPLLPPPAPPKPRSALVWVLPLLGVTAITMLAGGLLIGRRVMRSHAVRAAAGSASTEVPAAPVPPPPVFMTALVFPTGTQHTPAEMLTSLEVARESLVRCHRAAVADGDPAVSDVSLFVTIHPSGFVWSVLDLDDIDPLPSKKKDRWSNLCVLGVASALHFPSQEKEDLTGAIVKLRFRPGAPDESPAPESTTTKYEATWVKEKPREVFPKYAITLHTHGRLLTFEYKDGSGVCVEYDKTVKCRWVQLDSNGRATFDRKPNDVLDGRWGFGQDETTVGTWKMAPAKPAKTK